MVGTCTLKLALTLVFLVFTGVYMPCYVVRSHDNNNNYNHRGSFVHEVLQKQFHDNFLHTCNANFSTIIQQWTHMLTHPGGVDNNKYLVFVMQEKGYRNGGLGDRLGGLVNAVTIALRLNRTLLIKSENNFGDLFKPYHPLDMNGSLYNYNNWTTWTHYNSSWEYNDDTEYDLWFCINHKANKNDQCSMEWGDVAQPVVKLRSNRAFLCSYSHKPNSNHYKQLAAYGVNDETDLFTLAGCLLRLALWPTDMLWTALHETLESHELDLRRRHGAVTGSTESNININDHKYSLKWQYLISVHVRCGDFGYLHRSADDACIHTPLSYPPAYVDNIDSAGSVYDVLQLPPHGEIDQLAIDGNPLDMGRCAKHILKNVTAAWHHTAAGHHDHHNHSGGHLRSRRSLASHELPRIVAHLASDQSGASKQLNATLHHPATILSPNGCHIELDPSFECLRLTVVYWFLLSFSDSLVVQSRSPERTTLSSPASGYSRFAALYGLKSAIVDGRDCHRPNQYEMSRYGMGNWFCM